MATKKSPAQIRLLVLDILKPHRPTIIELGVIICKLKSVDGVNITVYEVDEKTETVKATIAGKNINFEKIKDTLEEFGAVVHSIDKVSVGQKLVEEVRTHKDKD